MKNKIVWLVLIGLIITTTAFAQDEQKRQDPPVRAPFESGVLIDNQTVQIPYKNTLEFVIEHRFGTIDNGLTDMYGLYAPSNIRLGLNYSITDDIMVGAGITKDRKLTDLRGKYSIIKQTRNNSIPVSVSFYGNMAIDGREDAYFGEQYEFTNRFSYFSQLIFSHKFDYRFSFQVAPSFSHINAVDSAYEHDKLAVSLSGRARFSPQSSIIVNYDIPLHIESMQEHATLNIKPKPNLGVGWEVSTSTHVFQIFVGTADAMMPQYNIMFNRNDWTDGEIMLGFNITRLWSF